MKSRCDMNHFRGVWEPGSGKGFVSVGGETIVRMSSPVLALQAAVAAVDEAWSGALPSFGVTAGDGDPSVVVEQFSDAGLLAVVGAVGALTRRVEGLGAVVAAEVARRSPSGSGTGNLARRMGHAPPAASSQRPGAGRSGVRWSW